MLRGRPLQDQYQIDRPLPTEVTTAASQLLQYQRYPVFSWGWWWRRAIFFMPLAIIEAIADGNVHGVFSHDAAEAFAIAWRCAVVGLAFVGAGTLLAVGARHAGMRQSLERILVAVAVILGFFVFQGADRWATRYHTEVMCAHEGVPAQECKDPVKEIDDSALGGLFVLAVPAGLYFVFGGGIALVSYFREQRSWSEHQRRRERRRLELKISEADARLSILQAQIEPHFLFNTLASLRSLIHSEPQRAIATIDALVAHLRATLPQMRSGTETCSTLGQQLEICRSYLEVMRVRMGPRLTCAVDAPAALAALPFPPLILLSLVENAIKHGIEPAPGPREVRVEARLLTGNETVEVTVSDDGVGLREGFGSGVGLANIRSQLALRYGTAASLEMLSREPSGVTARLRLPVGAAP